MPTCYAPTFATFYDKYFTGWSRAFSRRLVVYLGDAAGRSALDLCCGTGVVSEALTTSGWNLAGVDVSPGMLALARQRLSAAIAAGSATLIEANVCEFALPHSVDVCVCLDGSLNHLESFGDLRRCLFNVRTVLQPHGEFYFDLFEPSHFLHWNTNTRIEDDWAAVTKTGSWDSTEGVGQLRICGRIGTDGDHQRIDQTLHARTFDLSQVESALASAGMIRIPCDLECTTEGMRPEALRSDGRNRTLYRARAVMTAPLGQGPASQA